MKAVFYCPLLFLLSCNNNQTDSNAKYFAGKDVWETKCSPCHSFLTFEGLNQTSLSQMRELRLETLYEKIRASKKDSNHTRTPFNVKDIGDEELRNIAIYIKRTGEPTP